ncbi:Peptidase M20 domain-containing protein 2 [Vanrija pseudolonga]|uniref:Peptidase M20 domain-containing protein 2 n=1 Tax=Vanrija pseudolonga TaxID=143232 RepID=A0AAF0Y2F0_9TREE|nr:Peptidase M20 domain-containing protein 2 [Vanrija pseudolonga]
MPDQPTHSHDCCSHEIPAPGAVAKRDEIFKPEAQETIKNTIEAHRDELVAISQYLNENPELAWKEVKSHAKLTSYLESQGFEVTNIADYPTAFRAAYTHGKGGRVFGLNSEYDALPGIGHACGHNLIAICGVGALLGIREAMKVHNIEGTVVLIGTPAEEGAAGKVKLLEAGAYNDLGACMMLHPGRGPGDASGGAVVRSLAIQHIKVEYFGKPAHAGLAPWEGVNALDAAVMAYSSIGVMRQQIKPESRIQGVITEGGGRAANVIPAHTELNYLIRAPTALDLGIIREKMLNCFEGAAVATGCTHTAELGPEMTELRNEKTLATEYAHVMGQLWHIPVQVALGESMGASTDFGNVTHFMPACHPMYGIPAPGGNHTPEFTAAAVTPRAHDESIKAMTAMACVGMRYLADGEFADSVAAGFEDVKKQLADEQAAAGKV